MIKAIVTDCFGVLYNDILRDMLARHNISDPAILKACFKAAQASDLGDITLDEFFGKLAQLTKLPLQTICTEMTDVSQLNVGFLEILKHLKAAHKIGMITDADAELIAPFLTNQHVGELFNEVVISSEVRVAKPQPQIFEVMVEGLGVAPSEIIFIDNSEINTQAAAGLGMMTILYTNNEALNISLHSHMPSATIS